MWRDLKLLRITENYTQTKGALVTPGLAKGTSRVEREREEGKAGTRTRPELKINASKRQKGATAKRGKLMEDYVVDWTRLSDCQTGRQASRARSKRMKKKKKQKKK